MLKLTWLSDAVKTILQKPKVFTKQFFKWKIQKRLHMLEYDSQFWKRTWHLYMLRGLWLKSENGVRLPANDNMLTSSNSWCVVTCNDTFTSFSIINVRLFLTLSKCTGEQRNFIDSIKCHMIYSHHGKFPVRNGKTTGTDMSGWKKRQEGICLGWQNYMSGYVWEVICPYTDLLTLAWASFWTIQMSMYTCSKVPIISTCGHKTRWYEN